MSVDNFLTDLRVGTLQGVFILSIVKKLGPNDNFEFLVKNSISKGALADRTKNRSKFEIDALQPNKRQKNDLRTDRMSNMWFVCKKVQERRS